MILIWKDNTHCCPAPLSVCLPCRYFSNRFPMLLLGVFFFALQNLSDDPNLAKYFTPPAGRGRGGGTDRQTGLLAAWVWCTLDGLAQLLWECVGRADCFRGALSGWTQADMSLVTPTACGPEARPHLGCPFA